MDESFRIAVRLAGTPSESGRRLAVLRTGGRARFIVDAARGARGPRRAGVWRPATARGLAAAVGLDAAAAAGRSGEALVVDPELGVEGLLARELGLPGLRLEAIALSRVRPRSYATLFQDGRPACFVKAFRAAAPVEREHAVLEALTRAAPSSFLVPRPLAVLHWDDLSLLVLEPLAPRGLSVRGFGDDDAAVLAELPELAAALEPALGAEEGLVPRHGDFAPWNTGRVEAGYAVWDWESARLGPPLHDFFHWHVQLLALHPRSIDGLVRLATSPRGHLAALTARLGLDADAPAAALAGYLRTRVANAADPPPLRELLRSGLALLGEGEAEA